MCVYMCVYYIFIYIQFNCTKSNYYGKLVQECVCRFQRTKDHLIVTQAHRPRTLGSYTKNICKRKKERNIFIFQVENDHYFMFPIFEYTQININGAHISMGPIHQLRFQTLIMPQAQICLII